LLANQGPSHLTATIAAAGAQLVKSGSKENP
jgi:hypothetical protein